MEWCDDKHKLTHSLGRKINQINIKTKKVIATFNSIKGALEAINKQYDTGIITA